MSPQFYLSAILCALICFPQGDLSAQAPTINRTPPVLKKNHDSPTVSYRVTIRPGVAQPGQSITVQIGLASILQQPDPTFGDRKPIDDAKLTAWLIPPKNKKNKEKVQARVALNLRDAGSYGLSFSPTHKGIYGLHFRGQNASGEKLSYEMKLPFGVWPMDEKAKLPPLPRKLPSASLGNIEGGRRLCDQHCLKNVPGALPTGGTPRFIQSSVASSLGDAELLELFLGPKGKGLTELKRHDMLFYLRSLHFQLAEFFPKAKYFLTGDFTINEHGVERLKDTARLKLKDSQKSATVVIAFKGDKSTAPDRLIKFEDRVQRDLLDTSDKLGYILFFEVPGDKKAKELALALGKEPSYPIMGIGARAATGKRDRAYNRRLRSYLKKGSFNNARSLNKGDKSLRKRILPIYLRAAELATMYYADEREFTAFDSEFD
jgi:hypothetical protein